MKYKCGCVMKGDLVENKCPLHGEPPVNDFETGEKVIYEGKGGYLYEAVIFGISPEPDFADREYAITFKTGGKIVNTTTWRERLMPFKDKNELVEGDQFIDAMDNERWTVKFVGFDKMENKKEYYSQKNSDGLTDLWYPSEINKVVY